MLPTNDFDSERQPLWARYSMELHGSEPSEDAEAGDGTGLRLNTSRGEIRAIFHCPQGDNETAVLWLSGSRGGVNGPANGLYLDLAVELAAEGIASLRLDYRMPANLDESTLDALAGVWHLAESGFPRIAVVGHSFGGGVAISVSRYSTHVRGVAALASQTLGAQDVVLLSPRPLLLVHGEADDVLPVANAELIYGWAFEPKRVVTYPGAKHGLREAAGALRELLREWLPKAVAS